MREQGGVVHTADAKRAGHSARALAEAVSAGVLERVRRSWIAVRGADPDLLVAASAGGPRSCVSEARASGLWVPERDGLTHIAVRPTASRVRGENLAVHWGSGPVPARPGSIRDHGLNVLYHVARCQPRRVAFAVWESAVRTGKTSPEVLERVNWGSPAARAIADGVSSYSDSGLESIFVDGVRALGLPVRQQVWIDGHPLDAVIGERLLVQLDGFAFHSSASQRRRDIHADARLALRGYTPLRFDWYQVMFEWPAVEEIILTAVAQGLHLDPSRR